MKKKEDDAKRDTTKTSITAVDILNNRVLPYFERNDLSMLRILTTMEQKIAVGLSNLNLEVTIKEKTMAFVKAFIK